MVGRCDYEKFVKKKKTATGVRRCSKSVGQGGHGEELCDEKKLRKVQKFKEDKQIGRQGDRETRRQGAALRPPPSALRPPPSIGQFGDRETGR